MRWKAPSRRSWASSPCFEELDLSQNQLAGPLPPELGNLGSLKELSIYSNPLTGPIPQEFIELQLVKFNWFETQLCSPPNPGLPGVGAEHSAVVGQLDA